MIKIRKSGKMSKKVKRISFHENGRIWYDITDELEKNDR